MSDTRNDELLRAVRRVARALGVEEHLPISIAIELEKSGHADRASADLLLLALGEIAQQVAPTPEPKEPAPVMPSYLWSANLRRHDDELLGQGFGRTWAEALRYLVLPHDDSEPWRVHLRGPDGAEASLSTRSGVARAIQATHFSQILAAMHEERRPGSGSVSPKTEISADFGEFTVLAPLHGLRDRLKRAGLDEGLVWVFPESTLPGVTAAYGLPVVRADVSEPMLAHRPEKTH